MEKYMSDENLSLEAFVPAKAELSVLAGKAKGVDVKNAEQVHDVRIELRDARISITKRGKELREGALKFQKEVIKREGELVAIIEPEEERLKAIDEENKLREEMEKRRHELPSRLDALVAIGDEVTTDEDELLAMDDNEFNAYRLRRIEGKLLSDKAVEEEKRRIDLEEREARARHEEAERKAKIEAEDKERQEKFRAEEVVRFEKMRIEDEARMEERRKIAKEQSKVDAEKARIKAEEKARADIAEEQRLKLELEKREEDRKKKILEDNEKEQRYMDYLKSVGWNDDDHIVEWRDGIASIYKLVGKYNPNL